jgi:hypothetical protein
MLEADGAPPGAGGDPPAPAAATTDPGGGGETDPPGGAAPADDSSVMDAAAALAAQGGEGGKDAGDDPWKGTWISQLPDETRQKHKDRLTELKGKRLSDVLDEFFTAKQTLNRAVVFPQKGSAPEEVQKFLKVMGIPQKPEEYGLKPEILGPGEEVKTFVQNLAARMHRNGLTRKQGAQMFAEIASMVKAGISQQEAARKTMIESFDSRVEEFLGKDSAKAEDTRNYFKRFLVSLKDRKLVKDMDESGILYNPRFVAALAGYHKENTSEPPLVAGGRGGAESGRGTLAKSDDFIERYGGRR